MNWKHGVILFFLAILIIFVVQNYQVVEINFLIWNIKASRAIVLFLTLLSGFILGWTLAHLRNAQTKVDMAKGLD